MSPEVLAPLAMSAALAWAAGVRFYGVVFCVGLLGGLGLIELPGNLGALTHPVVIAISGTLFLLEFFADKVPIIDTAWDAVNTFVRIPGGALLAAMALADGSQGLVMAAALLGGGIAAGTHVAKASARAAINLSPEPVSNWLASLTEDALAFGIVLLALIHPGLLLVCLAAFVLGLLWLVPRLFRMAASLIRQGLQSSRFSALG